MIDIICWYILQYCIDWARIHSEKAIACRVVHKMSSREKRIAVLKFLKASLLEKFVRFFGSNARYVLAKIFVGKKIIRCSGTEWFIVSLMTSGKSVS